MPIRGGFFLGVHAVFFVANAINIMQIEDCSFSFGTVGRLLNHLVGLGRLRPFAFY